METRDSTAKILLKTLLFTLVAPGTVAFALPALLVRSPLNRAALRFDPRPWRPLAALLLVKGAAIYAWTALDFVLRGRGTPNPDDPPRELVVTGLFRYTRNPMYIGVLSMVFGVAFWLGSLLVMLYAAVAFAVVHLRVLLYEEPVLLQTFGDFYRRYLQSVPRWIPRLPR